MKTSVQYIEYLPATQLSLSIHIRIVCTFEYLTEDIEIR